jgi:hypothetical protein
MPIATITLNAGETFWVPKTATLLSVDATDGLVLQGSDCISTTVPARICMTFTWITDEDDNTEHPWDNGTLLKSINNGTTTYLFTAATSAKSGTLGSLQTAFPYQSLIEFVDYDEQAHETKRIGHVLKVSVPASFIELYLEFTVPHTSSTTTSLFAKGVIVDCEPIV